MRIPDARHAWNVTPKEAVQVQKRLRETVRTDLPLPLDRVRLVAGVDVSMENVRFGRPNATDEEVMLELSGGAAKVGAGWIRA